MPGVKGLVLEADHVRSRRRLRMSGAVPTLPLYVFMSCIGTALPFVLYCNVTCVSVRTSNSLFAKYLSTRKMICANLQKRIDARRLPNMAWPGLDSPMTGTDGRMLSTW
jgi:hypothetical protein